MTVDVSEPATANDPGQGAQAPPSARLEAAIAWLALVGLVLLVSAVGILALHLRDKVMEEAEARATDTVRVLAEHAARLFDAADLLVVRAAEETRERDWFAIEQSRMTWERLRREAARFPFVDAVWLNDDTGRLRLTTFGFPAPPAMAADRDFFTVHTDGPDIPYVSELIIGRVTGEPTFLVSRRLANPMDGFRGIASITMKPSYFSDFYRQLDLPYEPTILLYRSGGKDVVVQHPAPSPGATISFDAAVADAMREAPAGGTVYDGSTLFTYRALTDWPVGVAVRMDLRLADAAWRSTLWPYLLVAMAGATALVGLAAFGFRQAHAARRAQRALEDRVRDRTASLEAALGQRNALVAQKDLLMQEVNHRIKNSLQVVSSLLALQGQSAPEGEARRQIAEAGRRVRAVSDIHTLLYRGENVRAVPFHEYLTDLCRDLERSALQGEEWRLELALEPAEVPTDRAVPLGLIANELVMNAVKHAYPGDGDKPIRVGLTRVDAGIVRLTVADRGVGLPDGFDWRRSRSLGMRVVHALSAQLDAELEVRSTEPGTEFAVTVRLAVPETEGAMAVSAPP